MNRFTGAARQTESVMRPPKPDVREVGVKGIDIPMMTEGHKASNRKEFRNISPLGASLAYASVGGSHQINARDDCLVVFS